MEASIKRTAIFQARRALKRASESRIEMDSPSIDDQIDSWEDFVHFAEKVFQKIKRGADRAGPSNDLLKRLEGQRDDDPLLEFMRAARQTEFHGIEAIGSTLTGYMLYVKSGDVETPYLIDPLSVEQPDITIGVNDTIRQEKVPQVLRLISVPNDKRGRGRGTGQTANVAVPRSHFGNPILDPTPKVMADLMLLFLEDAIQEAIKFAEAELPNVASPVRV